MNRLRTSLLGLTIAASLATAAGANAPTECIGCNFSGADLHGGNMRNARYIGSNFANANLRNADLHNAKLIGVNFGKSDMRNAQMQSSVLIGANFSDANLDGASLAGAAVCVQGDDGVSCIDLRHASVVGANFRGALFCRGRRMTECIPVTSAMLRDHSHNTLEGAILP